MCANAFNLIIIMAQCQTERKRLWRILCAVVANIVIIFYFGIVFFFFSFVFFFLCRFDKVLYVSYTDSKMCISFHRCNCNSSSRRCVHKNLFDSHIFQENAIEYGILFCRFGMFTLCICFRERFVCAVINASIVYCFYLFSLVVCWCESVLGERAHAMCAGASASAMPMIRCCSVENMQYAKYISMQSRRICR